MHWFYVPMFYQPRAYFPVLIAYVFKPGLLFIINDVSRCRHAISESNGVDQIPKYFFFAANIAIFCMSIHHIFLVTFRTDLLKSPYSWATCHGIMNTLIEPPKTIHLSISPNVYFGPFWLKLSIVRFFINASKPQFSALKPALWSLVAGFNHLEKYKFVNGTDGIPIYYGKS